jgi:predicted GNAT superfamily acetyltransferase
MPRPPTVRLARRHELPAAAALLAGTLGFAPRDAIPAWLMRTTDEAGGVTLVAVHHGTVAGASYALPALDGGRPSLFSCGLAVAPEHRGRRLGLALKAEQRRQALARGYASIRWTADPLNGRALRLYLSGLGALVTAYHAGLHDGLREDPGHPLDDLEVVWALGARPRLDDRDRHRVELPWSPAGPDADVARARVRDAMCELLGAGYVGCRIDVDAAAARCWIAFARVSA